MIKESENQDCSPLLEVDGLVKHFPVMKGFLRRQVASIKAVDGISFTLRKSETLALVGESGCGKTTAGRIILRLIAPTAGRVLFCERNLFRLSGNDLRTLRSEIQIIFQDPYSSLNPRMRIGKIVGEPLLVHNIAKGKEIQERVEDLLSLVGLSPWHIVRYPHEFSGGQRQRIGIARALAVNPKLIICDEPVSALDVSVQAQVINLLTDLQNRFGMSYIFIAHDLAVVKYISDRVAVMYLGKILELANKNELFANPRHPYTQALLSAVPIPEPTAIRQRILLQGDVPSPMNPPTGCRFHTRCQFAQDRCRSEEPAWKDTGNGHMVACHFWDQISISKRLMPPRTERRYQSRLKVYHAALEAHKNKGGLRGTE